MNSAIKIVAENDFFFVIDKPAGVSVHNDSPSLAEYLASIKKPLHFVNRLDAETSGLMIVAQKPELHADLAEALEDGRKFYRTLLRSPWKPTNPHQKNSAVWSWPISDKSEGRTNPQGPSSARKLADTRVEIIRINRYFTEAYVEILTGRQHQIRKHAALAKHAIVGDSRYNEPKYNANIAKIYGDGRMQLHAEKLVFEFNKTNFIFESKINFDHFFKEG